MDLAFSDDVEKSDAVRQKRPDFLFFGKFRKGFFEDFRKHFPKTIVRIHIIKTRSARGYGRKASEDQNGGMRVENGRKIVRNASKIVFHTEKYSAFFSICKSCVPPSVKWMEISPLKKE